MPIHGHRFLPGYDFATDKVEIASFNQGGQSAGHLFDDLIHKRVGNREGKIDAPMPARLVQKQKGVDVTGNQVWHKGERDAQDTRCLSYDQITQSLGYFETLNNPGIYGAIVYSKGALFFHALREEIGDEAFFQGLRDYFQDQRYKVARSDDSLRAFEAAAERPLSEFYESWLYTGGDG